MKLIKLIIKYFNSRCWHELEEINRFDKNNKVFGRVVTVVVKKCKKCGHIEQQRFWKDK